ncbi:serine hydrolase domain-containing protein [Jatrophihabitans sp.]|uniref:serine hydrolase domain-containing protein n=1 Tax=Jatrophihabitans sp. TaxID=1932789 RepID=UPI002C7A0D0A|nr:serine hydrolase domain-containing protein [Jatrophihabitans sp.]
MNPLQQVLDWPVPHAAAAVLGPSGVLAEIGDTTRRFPLASVTKPLAALATLVAVEEGAIELDLPVPDYAPTALSPELAAELGTMTLRHLLAHAAGLATDAFRRAGEVGARRIYSNAGFDLIGTLVTGATGIDFADYLAEAVLGPLRMSATELKGSPAAGAVGSVDDLQALIGELMNPTGLLHPETLSGVWTVQFPGLLGVLPGYGGQRPNDWGLGFEIRGEKDPHWTSPRNSPGSYGHFGRSGTMFWIDPQARLALVALADKRFGPWAIKAWPQLSDAVLDAFG